MLLGAVAGEFVEVEFAFALLFCVADELFSLLDPPFKILSTVRLSEIDSLRLPEDEELELEPELERDEPSSESSPPSQAPYIKAHLESLITS